MQKWVDHSGRAEFFDRSSAQNVVFPRQRSRVNPVPHSSDDEPANTRVGSELRALPLHEIDQELIGRVLEQDPAAFEVFVARMACLPRILDGLNGRLGSPLSMHDLADVAQDTLVLVWRKLDTFNGCASLETWVFGMARFELMNAVRKKRRRRTSALPDTDVRLAPDSSHEPLDFELLHRELALLDRSEAQVVQAKHFDELTFEEIGAQLGISINTVKTRYYRGISRLLERLEKSFRGREHS